MPWQILKPDVICYVFLCTTRFWRCVYLLLLLGSQKSYSNGSYLRSGIQIGLLQSESSLRAKGNYRIYNVRVRGRTEFLCRSFCIRGLLLFGIFIDFLDILLLPWYQVLWWELYTTHLGFCNRIVLPQLNVTCCGML